MISIQQMNYILAVVEQKSFQRASEICFVTQPTLSMQLKKAEESLGKLIFDRSRNPITLTSYGNHLVPILRNILEENHKIQLLNERLSDSLEETIQVGIIPTISAYMLPDLFEKWTKLLPTTRMDINELRTAELLPLLEAKGIDLAILAGPYNQSGLTSNLLYEEEIYIYAPHIEGDITSREALSEQHPWLLSKGNCLRNQMIDFCEVGNTPKTGKWNYEGGSVEMLVKMSELFGGYTLVPEHYPLVQAKTKGIKTIVSDGVQIKPGRSIIGVYSNRSAKKDLIHKLLHSIQKEYNSTQPKSLDLINWNA